MELVTIAAVAAAKREDHPPEVFRVSCEQMFATLLRMTSGRVLLVGHVIIDFDVLRFRIKRNRTMDIKLVMFLIGAVLLRSSICHV